MDPQHVHIYSRPDGFSRSSLAGDLSSSYFGISFEQALASLELLPRMFVELDGSFVWTGQVAEQRWQIDGVLYDRQGHVQRLELKGDARRPAWEQLLRVFGWPERPLLAHLVDQQRLVELAEFLRSVDV